MNYADDLGICTRSSSPSTVAWNVSHGALVAHDDRIAGIEALVEHVAPGESRADQVPDQFVKLEPIERGHRGRAPPTLEAVFELRVGNEVDARRHLQRRRARERAQRIDDLAVMLLAPVERG